YCMPLIITSCLMLFATAGIHGASAAKAPKDYFKLDRAPHYAFPKPSASVADSGPVTPLPSLGRTPTQSPGYQVGTTTFDHQHIGSMGRQIGFNPVNDIVHMVWSGQTTSILPGDLTIYYQAFEAGGYPPTYLMDPSGLIAVEDYSGYVSLDASDDGKAVFSCNVDKSGSYLESCVYSDFLPAFGIFTEDICLTPDGTAPWYFGGMETVWPKFEIHYGTDEVHYVLTHADPGSPDMILYRKVGAGLWDNGVKVEDCTNISYVIVADDNSDRVAIVYTDDRDFMPQGSGGGVDLDVYFIESTNQGANWSPPINVTEFTYNNTLYRAYTDLSALYTDDGELHIIYAARELKNPTTYYNFRSRLFHWSTADPYQYNIIADASYQMIYCSPGQWNLYLAKPSLSVCDGKLYALWTQFGHDNEPLANVDFSVSGYANGELYYAVSADGGMLWDYPLNLTNTRNPGCTAPDCESEHWASMSKTGVSYPGYLDTLDIIYISDLDPGSILDAEGSWQMNPVMHLRLGCRDINLVSNVLFNPQSFGYPLNTPPGDELYEDLFLTNTGTAILNWTAEVDYIDGSDWIDLSHTSGLLPEGLGYEDAIFITFNYGGILTQDLTSWEANIIFTSDAPTSPDTIPVHLTISHDDFIPIIVELNTTCKSVNLHNTGRIGGNSEYASLDIPDDCDSIDDHPHSPIYLYDASPMITRLDGDDTLSFTTILNQYFTEDYTFRPQTSMELFSGYNYDSTVYTVITSDEQITVDVSLWAPNDGSNCFIIGRYDFALADGADPIYDVNLGMIADWDIPSDTGVKNGSDYYRYETPNGDSVATVWQFGLEAHDDNQSVPCDISEDDRLGGVVLLKNDFRSAWTENSVPYHYGPGLHPSFLYESMEQTGYNLFADPYAVDMHTGVTFDKVDLGTTRASHSYVFALVTTNEGEYDYLNQVDAAYIWAFDHGLISDSCDLQRPGDANNDGVVNVGDAVWMTNSLCEKSGLPPVLANGDANGDCVFDIRDAFYMQDYIFYAGDDPVECTCVEPEVIYSDCNFNIDSCSTDPALIICPAGDMPFRVYVRDDFGNPLPESNPFRILIRDCYKTNCPSDTSTSYYYYSGPSDANGIISFYIDGGGCGENCVADISYLGGLLFTTVPVKMLDRNGDLQVTNTDYDSSTCNDFNGDGEIDFHDIALFNDHLGHSCDSLDPCDRFGYEFTMDPESNLNPDDTVELRLELTNNNLESDCYIGEIEFFTTPYGDDTSGVGETPISVVYFDSTLEPGQMAITTVDYTIPMEGHGCVNVRFSTDCCDDPIVKSKCFQSFEHCRVDSNVCYNMVIRLSRTPIMSARWHETIMPDWNLIKLHEPTYPLYEPDSVVFDICTPDLTSLGDSSAIVYQVFYDAIGVKSSLFQNRVVLTSRTGDVNNDCRVNVGDVVFIINYVFSKPGALAPDPLESADVNHDEAVNVGDAVYLINFVFKGGPAPGLLPPTP
ncbi:MAG: hypothetical protein GY841_22255, partial [FCB group bacterium]|nr:hypothetical protein [FCB group bacterium]